MRVGLVCPYSLSAPGGVQDQVVGLEFELPGTGEVIWARGAVCHERRGGPLTSAGVRFDAMPRVHARLGRRPPFARYEPSAEAFRRAPPA